MQVLAVCAMTELGTFWVTVRGVFDRPAFAIGRILDFEAFVVAEQDVGHLTCPLRLVALVHRFTSRCQALQWGLCAC